MQWHKNAQTWKFVLLQISEGNKPWSVVILPEIAGFSAARAGKGGSLQPLSAAAWGRPGVLSSAVQGLCYPATSSSSGTDRFPTLHPNKTKSALTLQNVDEFFRVNQPCQPDVELSPTCDII